LGNINNNKNKKRKTKERSDKEIVYHIYPTLTVMQHESSQVGYDAILFACLGVKLPSIKEAVCVINNIINSKNVSPFGSCIGLIGSYHFTITYPSPPFATLVSSPGFVLVDSG
jgi:hypothetical protein